MASETEDPIDWSHPPQSWEVSPERLVRSINQCNLGRIRTCNRSMRGNHLADAATQRAAHGRHPWRQDQQRAAHGRQCSEINLNILSE